MCKGFNESINPDKAITKWLRKATPCNEPFKEKEVGMETKDAYKQKRSTNLMKKKERVCMKIFSKMWVITLLLAWIFT